MRRHKSPLFLFIARQVIIIFALRKSPPFALDETFFVLHIRKGTTQRQLLRANLVAFLLRVAQFIKVLNVDTVGSYAFIIAIRLTKTKTTIK